MRHLHLLGFFAIFLMSMSVNAQTTASSNNGFHVYAAAGPNFIFPSAFRLGWNRWEAGLLGRNFIGVNKTFVSPQSSVYAGFGLGVNSDPFQKNLGFQASVGIHHHIIWGIGLRAEILANANLNGNSMSHGLIGASYGF